MIDSQSAQTRRALLSSMKDEEERMTELEELLRQKAEIEAKIRSVKAVEADGWRLQIAKLATQLREINELPAALVSVFTDKAGTFNAYRTLKIKKP